MAQANPMIFQDSNGQSVKFFIQKDLSEDIQADLCENITSLGGRIETKVPRAGYILVQPNTPEEERLRACWTSHERPERFFVPYTYIEACKSAKKLIPQIFIENGQPIPMYIHPSIANPNARNALADRIMHSGGNPNINAQGARVILADPNTDVFQTLVKTYQGDPSKYIESFHWVKKCILNDAVAFTPVVYKNPGGRRPGEERTQFTDDDEERLCQWIADKIPYKSTGGRTGNRLYQQLCEQAGEPEYSWVTRHTWQSWRERYKKNAARLDVMITAIVEQKRPAQGEKGQYGYVRQPEEKPKRTRKKRKADQIDESFVHSGAEGLVGLSSMVPPNGQVVPSHMGMHPPSSGFQMMDAPSSQHGPHHAHYPPMMHIASTSQATPPPQSTQDVPAVPSQQRKSPTREEDEEPEWAVRVGNAPPPHWAQPIPPQEGGENSNKKQRISEGSETEEAAPADLNETNQAQAQLALAALANLHVIDSNLSEIARESRFTLEEVKEYYDKCGEMGRTRARFQEMRLFLQEKFGAE
ncbi:hypothetical protein DFP72DRAFT_15044 [Ephemerocybe angulata]|uniref:DNA-binding protein RAP1 n=1 Tax=Ephemerocybe angulata TaxID=980116 RepID=A0A8H6IJ16_9AGAR|nr:hypothetical protein DFP72DRAFT_15044 [Tulosesus angulatus]